MIVPGNTAGYAKTGIAMMKHKTAAAKKPIHHAPIQTLLSEVNPILKFNGFKDAIDSVKHIGKSCLRKYI